MEYFWSRISDVSDSPGQHFVATTDPGSKLEALALHRACSTNRLGLAGRCAPLGEEQVLIGPTAVRKVLPRQLVENKGLNQFRVQFPPLTDV